MRAIAAAILVVLACAGCAKPTGPSALSFDSKDYAAVFDAAVECARVDKLQPTVVDRDLGVIETGPRNAGSLFEPWRTDNSGIEEGFDHTVNFERRRARIEFVPAGYSIGAPQVEGTIRAAALPGTDRAARRVDLNTYEGTIEMRVWVYVDRAFMPNQRLGSWTRGEMRYSKDPLDKQDPEDETTRTQRLWTPIGRDLPYEMRLGSRIQQSLAAAGHPTEAIPMPGAPGKPVATAESPGTDPLH